MNIKKHVPNFITLLNLFCGCVAIVFVFKNDFELAFLFVSLGIFLDFFDGFFARLFHVSSPLGLQLDSLADMVTSGVTPGVVMFFLMHNALKAPAFVLEDCGFLFCLSGFIITLGSCYRLANFNIDTRQTDSFIGLPTPANALFIMSLPLVLKYSESLAVVEILANQWILLAIVLFSAYILNAGIPLFSLKIKKLSLKDNALQFGFLIFAFLLLVLLQYLAVPLIIISYILLSVLYNRLCKKEL
jgi:CDP-diacylglycerol---serine O-phosphatidyltransferase